jgi:prephenate dehydrogenase
MKTWDTVAIVGVGLIGASIGLALRKRKLATEVIGIGRRESSLRTAKRRGAVTRTTTDLAEGVANAAFVVVCTPVETIPEQVRAVALNCRKGARITDVGSAKEEIVTALDHAFSQHNPRDAVFVGSHPMAGSEKNGPQHGDAELFQDCVTVITPSALSNAKAVREVSRFWKSLGAKTLQLGPKEHDQAVAAISHLPHLVSSVLAACSPQSALPLAAGGWRDTTRVAGGDPHLWRQILSQNRFHVLHALDKFCHELTEFRRALAYNDRDRIEQLLVQGKQVRDSAANTQTKTAN